MSELLLDDIWADEAGVSLRFIATDDGGLRIEVTTGIGQPATASGTLRPWRIRRALDALEKGVELRET